MTKSFVEILKEYRALLMKDIQDAEKRMDRWDALADQYSDFCAGALVAPYQGSGYQNLLHSMYFRLTVLDASIAEEIKEAEELSQ